MVRRMMVPHPQLAVLVTNALVQADANGGGVTVDEWDTNGALQLKPALGVNWSAGVDVELLLSTLQSAAPGGSMEGSHQTSVFVARRIEMGGDMRQARLWVSEKGIFSESEPEEATMQ
eukprot:TRINITY_DN11814_c0_g1_i1.p1 TRINITY_DN11814_c0_g1~~TRINITY_DN11814_c0_g1_i1.p1  ORF type:complete len:118 (+),score=12.15 TRINITY_DN11814_c0_g1_i1:3-356(+)